MEFHMIHMMLNTCIPHAFRGVEDINTGVDNLKGFKLPVLWDGP